MKQQVKWSDLTIKEKLAIISAITAFILGWGLSIAAFIVPPIGIVSDGILWILGQALLYAASVFGITGYFSAETVKLRHDMDRHLEHMERMQLQRERMRHKFSDDEPEPDYDEEYDKEE